MAVKKRLDSLYVLEIYFIGDCGNNEFDLNNMIHVDNVRQTCFPSGNAVNLSYFKMRDMVRVEPSSKCQEFVPTRKLAYGPLIMPKQLPDSIRVDIFIQVRQSESDEQWSERVISTILPLKHAVSTYRDASQIVYDDRGAIPEFDR